MNADLAARILELLRETPAHALPLREVHRVLATEIGAGAGSLTQLIERLRTDPGPLLVVEPESPLGDGRDWPAAARSEYERALREAGIDTEPWITAVAAGAGPSPDSPLAEIDASLLDLWEAAGAYPRLRSAIAEALAETRAGREGPPRDLP